MGIHMEAVEVTDILTEVVVTPMPITITKMKRMMMMNITGTVTQELTTPTEQRRNHMDTVILVVIMDIVILGVIITPILKLKQKRKQYTDIATLQSRLITATVTRLVPLLDMNPTTTMLRTVTV